MRSRWDFDGLSFVVSRSSRASSSYCYCIVLLNYYYSVCSYLEIIWFWISVPHETNFAWWSSLFLSSSHFFILFLSLHPDDWLRNQPKMLIFGVLRSKLSNIRELPSEIQRETAHLYSMSDFNHAGIHYWLVIIGCYSIMTWILYVITKFEWWKFAVRKVYSRDNYSSSFIPYQFSKFVGIQSHFCCLTAVLRKCYFIDHQFLTMSELPSSSEYSFLVFLEFGWLLVLRPDFGALHSVLGEIYCFMNLYVHI